MCAYVCVWILEEARRGQWIPLELTLQVIVSHYVGAKLGSSARIYALTQ